MTTKELRELDAWIAEHVLKFKRVNNLFDIVAGKFFDSNGATLIHYSRNQITQFSPTCDSIEAMKVLEKCAGRCCVTIEHDERTERGWIIARLTANGEDFTQCQTTLPLAICLFAKRLFSKSPKCKP